MSIQIQFYADQRQLQSIILIDILYRYKNIKKSILMYYKDYNCKSFRERICLCD